MCIRNNDDEIAILIMYDVGDLMLPVMTSKRADDALGNYGRRKLVILGADNSQVVKTQMSWVKADNRCHCSALQSSSALVSQVFLLSSGPVLTLLKHGCLGLLPMRKTAVFLCH